VRGVSAVRGVSQRPALGLGLNKRSSLGGSFRRSVATTSPPSASEAFFTPEEENVLKQEHIELSGLQGKALRIQEQDWPKMHEVYANIPKECWEKDDVKSMAYAVISTALTVGTGLLAYLYIPLQASYWPAWLAYAIANGTFATGCWVIAHECGHNAFSNNKTLQDTVGYVLHSALLVPYFSWQRSHAVHHARTNHLSLGETHVPYVRGDNPEHINKGGPKLKVRDFMMSLGPIGNIFYGVARCFTHLVFGWPAYLLWGATGGPVRGTTNHFNPWAGVQEKDALFPGKWKKMVLFSDIGCVATFAALVAWGLSVGSVWPPLALYAAPLVFTNCWLVLYTWLQHTDVDIPHYAKDTWVWAKGAFSTVDRPYGAILDFLHHRIGSTHVAHHVSHEIPHYNAVKATEALKETYPKLYLYDPTNIWVALWRVCTKCTAVERRTDSKMVEKDMYVFVN